MTPSRLMRTLLPLRLRAAHAASTTTPPSAVIAAPTASRGNCSNPRQCLRNCRCFAHVHDIDTSARNIWFNSAAPLNTPFENQNADHKPPDERTLQLGKTVRILHERLPHLLKEPLPSEVLSPQITLHLFPSTHPHLPTVSGRIAYIAALWTAPVAWGRVPLVGNVELVIISERMIRNGGSREEKLVVKWKTCGKTSHRDGTGGIYRGIGISGKDPVERILGFVNGTKAKKDGVEEKRREEEEEFCGIFVFEFDEKGRVVKHVIEHAEEGGDWDRMTRVVSVTDWLLGVFNGKKKEEMSLAWCEERPRAGRIRMVDRT